MSSSLVALQQALDDLIDPARIRKHWNKHDDRWATAADVSLKTLQRFWSRVAIRRTNFIAICQAIDIEDWKEIADLSSQQLSRPSASSVHAKESNISVKIEGSTSAPLSKITYYTVTSQNAIRGVWSVGGFQNEPIDVNPLDPSHQIFIEPTNKERIGESFTIVFTAYDVSGKSATAIKFFTVISDMKGISNKHQGRSILKMLALEVQQDCNLLQELFNQKDKDYLSDKWRSVLSSNRSVWKDLPCRLSLAENDEELIQVVQDFYQEIDAIEENCQKLIDVKLKLLPLESKQQKYQGGVLVLKTMTPPDWSKDYFTELDALTLLSGKKWHSIRFRSLKDKIHEILDLGNSIVAELRVRISEEDNH